MVKKSINRGSLVISLDFELFWGKRYNTLLEDFREALLGVRQAVPALLQLFKDFEIHATWATVGFLFFESREEMLRELPVKKPEYEDKGLSPYDYINNIGRNEKEDPFHFAPSLVKTISSSLHQEIGSHTFSHYYCLEKGQSAETFKYDLETAIKLGEKNNIEIKSLVFPRNQVNAEYLPICKELGIAAYRGNEYSFLYRKDTLLTRALRLIDAHINISGHNCYSPEEVAREFPFCIPSSRFLRPYTKKYEIFKPLRLRRILSGLTYAARRGLIYHLWWHPYNFGVNLKENLSFLKQILNHFVKMKRLYGMESRNMGEISSRLLQKKTL